MCFEPGAEYGNRVVGTPSGHSPEHTITRTWHTIDFETSCMFRRSTAVA
jgi:hypothetical protein